MSGEEVGEGNVLQVVSDKRQHCSLEEKICPIARAQDKRRK